MGEDKKKEKKSKKKDKEAKKEEPKKEEPKEEPKKEEEAPKKEEPKRAQRGTSNVFALFNQSQIQEFKEAFQMMDNDRDGFLSQDDLAAIYQNTGRDPDPKTLKDMLAEAPGQINFTAFLTLFGEKMTGRNPDDKMLETMLSEAPGPLNFTMFLTLFGDKMRGTDPEQTLRDAFKMFDSEGNGKLDEAYVKDLLMNTGDQFNKDEIKQTWKEAPIEGGKLDYLKFVLLIKRGPEDEQPAA